MRVNSDNQTLILASEAIPHRLVRGSSAGAPELSGGRRLTIIATPVGDPRLLTQANFAGGASSESAITRYQTIPLRSSTSSRGGAFNGAHAYASTQDLTDSRRKTAIIDTYA